MYTAFELYNEENAKRELEYFDKIDQEKISIEGAPFVIWKLDLETTKSNRASEGLVDDLNIDVSELYGEALPSSMAYIKVNETIKGSYTTPVWTQDLASFGITEPEEINIKFNKSQIVDTIGRPFIIGDIIKSFHEKHYVIVDTYVSEETAIWKYLHITVIAKKTDISQITLV